MSSGHLKLRNRLALLGPDAGLMAADVLVEGCLAKGGEGDAALSPLLVQPLGGSRRGAESH
jgi:hypothetical protein